MQGQRGLGFKEEVISGNSVLSMTCFCLVAWVDLKPMKLVENGTDSDDEEYEEPPSAYTSLLHTLQATSQSFAKVYAQRYSLPPF